MCLSVCTSQADIVLKWVDKSSWYFAWRLFSIYPSTFPSLFVLLFFSSFVCPALICHIFSLPLHFPPILFHFLPRLYLPIFCTFFLPFVASFPFLECSEYGTLPVLQWLGIVVTFSGGWASGLQFVFFWDTVNNLKCVSVGHNSS